MSEGQAEAQELNAGGGSSNVANASSTSSQSVGVALLPEEVLLLLFRLLDKRSLVHSVRPVCAQWLRLSGHPSLWKGVHYWLSNDYSLKDNILQIRVAPIVERLEVSLTSLTAGTIYRNLLDYDCSAKVNILVLRFHEVPTNPPVWEKLLRTYEKDVTSCTVLSQYTGKSGRLSDDQLVEFFRFTREAPQLKFLSVVGKAVLNFKPLQVSSRGLETLKVRCYPTTAPTALVSLVSGSLASLKAVDLKDVKMSARSLSLVMKALGQCPLLEDLTTPVSRGMSALSACSVLARLGIHGAPTGVFPVKDVAEEAAGLLRSLVGSELRELSVTGCCQYNAVLFPAVLTLSQLTSLTLDMVVFDPAGLLRSLPMLEELRLDYFPRIDHVVDDLGVITDNPGLVPKLRLLRVTPWFNTDEEVEGPEDVLDALCARRPDLRIEGYQHYEAKWKGLMCWCSQCHDYSSDY